MIRHVSNTRWNAHDACLLVVVKEIWKEGPTPPLWWTTSPTALMATSVTACFALWTLTCSCSRKINNRFAVRLWSGVIECFLLWMRFSRLGHGCVVSIDRLHIYGYASSICTTFVDFLGLNSPSLGASGFESSLCSDNHRCYVIRLDDRDLLNALHSRYVYWCSL